MVKADVNEDFDTSLTMVDHVPTITLVYVLTITLVYVPMVKCVPTITLILDQPVVSGVASFVAECLALSLLFWFGHRLFPSFSSYAPQRYL